MTPVRVAELFEPHRFRLREGKAEEPAPGQVQVRVEKVGICGSDLHNFSTGGIGDMQCVYPMVLGHESVGTVVKTGAGVSGWAAGDRAALEPAIYCYHCEYCLTGHHNVCAHIRFMSTPGDPGFLRDVVNLPVESLLPIPGDLSATEATLFEPLAVVLNSMRLADLRLGETAAVFGAGPIGLLTVLALRLSGAGRIWVVEPVPHRRELALALGADATIDPAAVQAGETIRAETGRRGVDVAIDCAAHGDSIDEAITAVRNAGRLVMTGIPITTRVSLDFHTMRRKELTFLNVRRSNHTSEGALEMLATHRSRFAPLLTHETPLEDVERAFSMLERYEDGVGKLVIRLS